MLRNIHLVLKVAVQFKFLQRTHEAVSTDELLGLLPAIYSSHSARFGDSEMETSLKLRIIITLVFIFTDFKIDVSQGKLRMRGFIRCVSYLSSNDFILKNQLLKGVIFPSLDLLNRSDRLDLIKSNDISF